MEAFIDGLPGNPSIVGAESPGSGNGNKNPIRIAGIEDDGVQAHPSGARLPVRTRAVFAKSRKFMPCLASVSGAEDSGVLDPGVDRVRIGKRRFKVPHAFEFPGMWCAVVPLMCARHAVIHELVAYRLPGLSAIVGALNHLPEP